MQHYPIIVVPDGHLRLDLLTHTAAVEGDTGYIEVFFVGGRSEVYHRDDIRAALHWLDAQAAYYATVQASIPTPSWDPRLDALYAPGKDACPLDGNPEAERSITVDADALAVLQRRAGVR